MITVTNAPATAFASPRPATEALAETSKTSIATLVSPRTDDTLYIASVKAIGPIPTAGAKSRICCLTPASSLCVTLARETSLTVAISNSLPSSAVAFVAATIGTVNAVEANIPASSIPRPRKATCLPANCEVNSVCWRLRIACCKAGDI